MVMGRLTRHFQHKNRHKAIVLEPPARGGPPLRGPAATPYDPALGSNLKTAKALGLTIPRALLLRADHVIE
jgi:hypothetical protein